MDESVPERPFSAIGLVSNLTASWKTIPDTEDLFSNIKEEPEFCFSWRSYPGNIYHGDDS